MEDDFDMEVEDILEDGSVEEGLEVLRQYVDRALDCTQYIKADENAVIIVESLQMALDILDWVDDKMNDVHFELDFTLDSPRIH